MSEIVSFQHRLTRRLMQWALLSVVAGMLLQLLPSRCWRAFGQQAFGWGAIDGAIALAGRITLERKRKRGYDGQEAEKDAVNLQRLLWINTGLDLLYVTGGARLMRTRGRSDQRYRGHGAGILVQGAFLLLFDLYFAIAVGNLVRRAR